MEDADSYASGNWLVKDGNIDEFLSRWREFLEWTRGNASGFQHAFLLRSQNDPRHFVSYSTWTDQECVREWSTLPDFEQKYEACRAVCETAEGSGYHRVMIVS